MRSAKTTLLLVVSIGLAVGCTGDANPMNMVRPTTNATYQVTFNATWSAATHPNTFPPGPHFSGLVGATHDASVSFWAPGALASPGIESMAETGSKTTLLAEVDAAILNGAAEAALSGGGISPSPGMRSLAFDITPGHSRVTLVTMIAPSPDWFVGVDVELVENGDWVATKTIELWPYDAGTDDGTGYTSANAESNPHVPIVQLAAPFSAGTPLGTLTFVRQ